MCGASEALFIQTNKNTVEWGSSPGLEKHSNAKVREIDDYLTKLTPID